MIKRGRNCSRPSTARSLVRAVCPSGAWLNKPLSCDACFAWVASAFTERYSRVMWTLWIKTTKPTGFKDLPNLRKSSPSVSEDCTVHQRLLRRAVGLNKVPAAVSHGGRGAVTAAVRAARRDQRLLSRRLFTEYVRRFFTDESPTNKYWLLNNKSSV